MTGPELRALRKAIGLSQEDFCYLLDVTIPTISAWETGKRAIHPLFADGIIARVKQFQEGATTE